MVTDPPIPFDAMLQWNVERLCNLKCAYCVTAARKRRVQGQAYHPDTLINWARHIRNRLFPRRLRPTTIDIPAVLGALERTGKTFLISFSGGGEPFLCRNLVEACERISQKHFVRLNTNLTPGSVMRFAERVDPRRVESVRASLHIAELERLGLTERFIQHFTLFAEKGFPIQATEVAHPAMLAEAPRRRDFFASRGVPLRFMIFLGEYEGRQYPEAYTEQELEVFGLRREDVICRLARRGQLCNAGFNVGMIANDGSIAPCAVVPGDIGSIYGEIRFRDRLLRCPVEQCPCPLFLDPPGLMEKALRLAVAGPSPSSPATPPD